jgi:hypothetical protein
VAVHYEIIKTGPTSRFDVKNKYLSLLLFRIVFRITIHHNSESSGMMMMEAARTSETSADNYFTRQYIPENNSEHHTRHRENLKSSG